MASRVIEDDNKEIVDSSGYSGEGLKLIAFLELGLIKYYYKVFKWL